MWWRELSGNQRKNKKMDDQKNTCQSSEYPQPLFAAGLLVVNGCGGAMLPITQKKRVEEEQVSNSGCPLCGCSGEG